MSFIYTEPGDNEPTLKGRTMAHHLQGARSTCRSARDHAAAAGRGPVRGMFGVCLRAI